MLYSLNRQYLLILKLINGVFAKVNIPKGEFLMEYRVELLGVATAAGREDYYDENGFGSFMLYFKSRSCKTMWGESLLIF